MAHCRRRRAAVMLENSTTTAVYMDSGIENVNGHVGDLFDNDNDNGTHKTLRRVLAQIDVSFSNSMIEAWWRSLKHQWLFLHSLDNIATVRRLVEFYVSEHNETIPHSAFNGQTPDEMYFGNGAQVESALMERRQIARRARLNANQQRACSTCPRASPAHQEDKAA